MGGSPVIRAFSLILALGIAPAAAQDFTIRSEIGAAFAWANATSLDTALGFDTRQTWQGQARLMWRANAGALQLEFAAIIGVAKGDDVLYRTAITPFLPPQPPASLFDLTYANITGDTAFGASIDRAVVSWASENLVLKAGRQAITWGEGLVFHPGDIVAPFAPNATDTSYKPGVDMLYGQYLFASGADIQAIWVPRPTAPGGAIDPDASTFALRAAFQTGVLDVALMAARDRADLVASLGLAGPLGEASWKAEYVGWRLASGAWRPSWLLNLSNFATIGGVNVSYFGEYFHNGFGVAPGTALDALPADLRKRLGTGQVFLPGTDYLALGASLQLSPDLSMTPSALVSLNDSSALLSLALDYSLGDNTNITFNYSQPTGATGTSFGGLETSTGSGIFATPARSAELKLVHFF